MCWYGVQSGLREHWHVLGEYLEGRAGEHRYKIAGIPIHFEVEPLQDRTTLGTSVDATIVTMPRDRFD